MYFAFFHILTTTFLRLDKAKTHLRHIIRYLSRTPGFAVSYFPRGTGSRILPDGNNRFNNSQFANNSVSSRHFPKTDRTAEFWTCSTQRWRAKCREYTPVTICHGLYVSSADAAAARPFERSVFRLFAAGGRPGPATRAGPGNTPLGVDLDRHAHRAAGRARARGRRLA